MNAAEQTIAVKYQCLRSTADLVARPVPNSNPGLSGRPLSGFRPAAPCGGRAPGGRTTKGGSLRSRGLPGRCTSRRRRTLAGTAACLSRQCLLRGCCVTFTLERFEHRARTRRRCRFPAAASLTQGSLRGTASALGRRSLLRCWQINSRLARL
jgi:hypothetical protein